MAASLASAAAAPNLRHDTLPPTAWAPPSAGSAEGRPLGSGYVLQEPIGHGASGQVWRGTDRRDGRPVAVKVLRPELADEPDAVVRFLRERTTLVGLAHPNLVRVRDLVAEGTTLAIVMDLVDGPDLRRLLAGGPLDPGAVAKLLAEVASALGAVHAAGIVHRDVKPENVLVERRGEVLHARLTDFGVARMATGAALTGRGRLFGTPEYVAPELSAGRPAAPASDVYAFGVMAYELLAGRRPFEGSHPAALLRAHLEDEPARPPALAEPFWVPVRSCLAKDPAARPTAEHLAAAFAALADGQPAPVAEIASLATGEVLLTAAATAPPPPAPPGPAPAKKRRLLPLALSVLVVACVGVLAGLYAAQRNRPDEPPPPAAPATHPIAVDVPLLASSPEPGRVTLQFSGGPERPGFQSYAVLLDDRVFRADISGSTTRYEVPFLDPEGEHCFRVVALIETTTTPTPAPPQKACLTPDGEDTASSR